MAVSISIHWRALVINDRALAHFHDLSVRLISLIAPMALRPRPEPKSLAFVVVDSNRSSALRSQLCSLPRSGLSPTGIIYITLDSQVALVVRQSGASVVQLDDWPLLVPDRFRLKLIVSYILVRLRIHCYVIDSDIIFFEDLSRVWGFVSDLELQTDDQVRVVAKDLPDDAEINSGFGRYSANFPVICLLKSILEFAAAHPDWWHQRLMNRFLKRSTRVGSNMWVLPTQNALVVSYSFIEPYLVPNGAVLLCSGREALCRFCQNRSIISPVAIHLNYHLPEAAKFRTLAVLGLNFSGLGHCRRPLVWSFWKTCIWPAGLICDGRLISQM
jgi:hypothetical protein